MDVPQRLLDDLAIYCLAYPPMEGGFVFRTRMARPMDPDTWHHRRLAPLLKKLGLYQRGMGLHAAGRHTYVSLLITQGEDVGYIADQVGHSTMRLTQDLYRHVFTKTRLHAMRRLGAAIPPSGLIGPHRAASGNASGTPGTGGTDTEVEPE